MSVVLWTSATNGSLLMRTTGNTGNTFLMTLPNFIVSTLTNQSHDLVTAPMIFDYSNTSLGMLHHGI